MRQKPEGKIASTWPTKRIQTEMKQLYFCWFRNVSSPAEVTAAQDTGFFQLLRDTGRSD